MHYSLHGSDHESHFLKASTKNDSVFNDPIDLSNLLADAGPLAFEKVCNCFRDQPSAVTGRGMALGSRLAQEADSK